MGSTLWREEVMQHQGKEILLGVGMEMRVNCSWVASHGLGRYITQFPAIADGDDSWPPAETLGRL